MTSRTNDDDKYRRYWRKFFTAAGIERRSHAEKYAEHFCSNQMRPSMLDDVDRSMLRDLGVTAVGDVLLIMKHIRKCVDDNEGDSAREVEESAPAKSTPKAPPAEDNPVIVAVPPPTVAPKPTPVLDNAPCELPVMTNGETHAEAEECCELLTRLTRMAMLPENPTSPTMHCRVTAYAKTFPASTASKTIVNSKYGSIKITIDIPPPQQQQPQAHQPSPPPPPVTTTVVAAVAKSASTTAPKTTKRPPIVRPSAAKSATVSAPISQTVTMKPLAAEDISSSPSRLPSIRGRLGGGGGDVRQMLPKMKVVIRTNNGGGGGKVVRPGLKARLGGRSTAGTQQTTTVKDRLGVKRARVA